MAIEPRNYRQPVKRAPAPPPALWRAAAPVVLRGAALVAAGILGEWALRSAARKAAGLPFSGKTSKRNVPAPRKSAAPEAIVAVSETVVVHRVIVRREG